MQCHKMANGFYRYPASNVGGCRSFFILFAMDCNWHCERERRAFVLYYLRILQQGG